MNARHHGFDTLAIHAGYDPRAAEGALCPPLHLSSTFTFEDAAHGAALFAGEREGHFYTRISNPTTALLEHRLAALEGGEAALATASGMGAITATLWSLVEPGDEVLADKTLYGCTFAFFSHGLERFGVRVHFVDFNDAAALGAALSERTRVLFCETPANPTMRLVDLAAVARVAHRAGAKLVVDNTYCTPALQRPLALGADLVVHSATKYLGGHGDLVAGAVIGRADDIARIRLYGVKDMTGAVISPFNAFLILRGLKTLSLRMERHSRSAQTVAERLAEHPKVAALHYPGLPGFPQAALARRQMRLPGGMMAFELEGGLEAGRRFMDALQLAIRAVSLGDAETLCQHPASMTHSTYTAEERAAHGIGDGLVRLSVGLEDPEDIVADLLQALEAA